MTGGAGLARPHPSLLCTYCTAQFQVGHGQAVKIDQAGRHLLGLRLARSEISSLWLATSLLGR